MMQSTNSNMIDAVLWSADAGLTTLGVVPLLISPLQALLALLPILLTALGSVLITMFKPRTAWLLVRLAWRQKLVLLIVTGAGFATYLAVDHAFASHSGRADLASAIAWSGMRGGMERRGYVPGNPDPTAPDLIWQYQPANNASIFSSPAVAGDYVLFTTSRITPFDAAGTGELLCVNAHTGEKVWRGQLADRRATFSSPSVSGQYVAVGEGLHETRDARLTIYDSQSGAVRWTYRTNSQMESSPVISDGRVFVGAGRDGYYAFELEPDDDGQPRMLWHAPGEKYMDASGSPAVHGDRVFVTMGRWGGQAVACLDATSGKELWRVDTPYPVFAGPTILPQRGLLLVGMGNGNFVYTAEQAMPAQLQWLVKQGATEAELAAAEKSLGPAGEVWAIDLESGQIRWRFKTARTVLGQIAVSHDRVYFGSRDGHLYMLDADGRERQRWNARAAIIASPAVTDAHVYIVTVTGVLHCLEAQTLKPVWEMALDQSGTQSAGTFFSSPTVAHGRVYIGTPSNGLLAVGRPTQPPAIVWPAFHGCAGGGGRNDNANFPSNVVPLSSPGEQQDARPMTGPLALHEDMVITPIQISGQFGIAAWPRHQSATSSPVWFTSTDLRVMHSPVTNNHIVAVTTAQRGQNDRQVLAYQIDNGRELWRKPLAKDADGALHLNDELLLISDHELLAVHPDTGEQSWLFDGGIPVGTVAVRHHRIAVATKDDLHLLDDHSGRTLWAIKLPAQPTAGPVFYGDMILTPTTGGVLAVSELDGKLRWQDQDSMTPWPLITVGNRVLVRTSDAALRVLNASTGELERAIKRVMQHPLVDQQSVYVLGRRGFRRIALDNGKHTNWLRFDESWGEIVTPPVAAAGQVYLGTTRGLVVLGEGSDR